MPISRHPSIRRAVFALFAITGLYLIGCDETGEGVAQMDPRGPAASLGLTAYLDAAEPVETTEHRGATVWTFAPDDGPMCLRGRPFRASMRTTGHEDLVIFLQGGGACWSAFCLAVNAAPQGVPRIDLLNPDLEGNPVADWNVLYLPYCDGSLFVGDRDHDDSGDGTPDRFHRGLHNLSAALSMGAREMPAPRRVLLAGASAGGYGSVLAALLVRHIWPEAELIVMNDSGVGIAQDGDPDFVRGLLEEFNALRFVPESCDGCLDEGHILPLVDWSLARMPGVRIGVFSSTGDSVIAGVFLDIEAEAYGDVLLEQTSRVHAAHPDAYRRFITSGGMHTTLLGDPSGIVGSDLGAVELPQDAIARLANLDLGRLMRTTADDGTPFVDWFRGLLEHDDAWRDIVP